MDNSTRRILLDKIKSSGYPGSVLDVYAAYDQGVDLVQDFMNQQMQAQGQQPQQQLQQPQQPQDQGQMQQQMQQMQQSPEPIPTQPPGVNLPTMQTPQENYVDSAGRTSIGLANVPETRSAEMINNPAKMQMGGSYQTNQEISMYEWNSGRPKQYLKGGLRTRAINRFANGGSTKQLNQYADGGQECGPGQVYHPQYGCISSRGWLQNLDGSLNEIKSVTRATPDGKRYDLNTGEYVSSTMEPMTYHYYEDHPHLRYEAENKKKYPLGYESVYDHYIRDYKKPDSGTENFIEMIDATGIASHDDARRAYEQWQKSGNTFPSGSEALDMFSAVPYLGKYSQFKYAVQRAIPSSNIFSKGQEFEKIFKYIPWQDILNLMGSDIGPDEEEKKKFGGGFTKMLYNKPKYKK